MEQVDKCASRFTEGLTVTIQLENTTKTFMVQRALLCSLSDYFTTALGGSFKEGRDNTLRLPGCDTETFKMFLYWACNRSLPEAPEPGKGTTPANQTFQFIMVKVWCFADAILLPQLQNDAMKALLDGLRYARVPVEAIRFTFENSANDSVLRKAILEEVYTGDEKDAMGSIAGFTSDLVQRIIAEGGKTPSRMIAGSQEQFMVK